jgi:hypothetical protein
LSLTQKPPWGLDRDDRHNGCAAGGVSRQTVSVGLSNDRCHPGSRLQRDYNGPANGRTATWVDEDNRRSWPLSAKGRNASNRSGLSLNPQVRGSNPRRHTKKFWKFTAGVRVLRGDPFFWIGPPATLSRTSIGPGPTLGTATRTLRMFGFVLTRRLGSSGQFLRWMNSDIERDGCTFEPKSQDATNDR